MKRVFFTTAFIGGSIFLFTLCVARQVQADGVILKSGKKIEGQIVETKEDFVKIDIGGVAITYFKDEIASVQSSEQPTISPSEKAPKPELPPTPKITETPKPIEKPIEKSEPLTTTTAEEIPQPVIEKKPEPVFDKEVELEAVKKLYAGYADAVKTGNWQNIKPFVAKPMIEKMEAMPTMHESLRVLQSLAVNGISFTGSEMYPQKATLIAQGKNKYGEAKGTIVFIREGESWKLYKEDWNATKNVQPAVLNPAGQKPFSTKKETASRVTTEAAPKNETQ